MRVLGLDFGLARIGIALSDEGRRLATPLGIAASATRPKEAISAIQKLLLPYGKISAIVIGWPLLLNGKESPMCASVRTFSTALEQAFGLPVIFWDERLTSAQVERTLKEQGFSRKERAKRSDGAAAAAILQNYLDSYDARSTL